MGITEYNKIGEKITLDEKLLEGIIRLRNKSFHGTKEKRDDAKKEYLDAVEKLLYIDEKILRFLLDMGKCRKTN